MNFRHFSEMLKLSQILAFFAMNFPRKCQNFIQKYIVNKKPTLSFGLSWNVGTRCYICNNRIVCPYFDWGARIFWPCGGHS